MLKFFKNDNLSAKIFEKRSLKYQSPVRFRRATPASEINKKNAMSDFRRKIVYGTGVGTYVIVFKKFWHLSYHFRKNLVLK